MKQAMEVDITVQEVQHQKNMQMQNHYQNDQQQIVQVA